jgi:hypothetical protein
VDDLLHLIVKYPLVLGAFVNLIIKLAHTGLIKLDKSGKLAPYSVPLHKAYLVLAFITSAVGLASQGQLENIDTSTVENFAVYWITVILGGKALEPVINPKK